MKDKTNCIPYICYLHAGQELSCRDINLLQVESQNYDRRASSKFSELYATTTTSEYYLMPKCNQYYDIR